MKLASKRKRAVRDEAKALKEDVEAKVDRTKTGFRKLEEDAQEDIDASEEEIKHASKKKTEIAKQNMRLAKRAKARADVDKKKAAIIKKATVKAMKGSEPHVRQLKELRKKATKLDQIVQGDAAKGAKGETDSKELLVNTLAKRAKKEITKIKAAALKVNK